MTPKVKYSTRSGARMVNEFMVGTTTTAVALKKATWVSASAQAELRIAR